MGSYFLSTFSLAVVQCENVVESLGGGALGGSQSLGVGHEVLFIPQYGLGEKLFLRLTYLNSVGGTVCEGYGIFKT